MRILITNDDGVHAAGIRSLARAAAKYGDVKVVAPDRERSACGHAMTMRDPLRVEMTEVAGFPAYAVNGLPVDCVNIGLHVAWPDGCDLVLSGINHGPNLGFDVTYSGTVAGAMEGCINGIRSLSFSMALFVDGAPLHLETGEAWIAEHLGTLMSADLPPQTFLNVNIPALASPEIQGVKVVPMGQRVYEERVEVRQDPWGRTYYWQGGVVAMRNGEAPTDVGACSKGYVSVTPITLDWTHHTQVEALRKSLTF